MDGMTQPPMPNGAPQSGGNKKAVLWIVLVVLAVAVIVVWLLMGSVPNGNPDMGTPAENTSAPLPPSRDTELNAIGSDLQNINAGNPAPDFQAIDKDVQAL